MNNAVGAYKGEGVSSGRLREASLAHRIDLLGSFVFI